MINVSEEKSKVDKMVRCADNILSEAITLNKSISNIASFTFGTTLCSYIDAMDYSASIIKSAAEDMPNEYSQIYSAIDQVYQEEQAELRALKKKEDELLAKEKAEQVRG